MPVFAHTLQKQHDGLYLAVAEDAGIRRHADVGVLEAFPHFGGGIEDGLAQPGGVGGSTGFTAAGPLFFRTRRQIIAVK